MKVLLIFISLFASLYQSVGHMIMSYPPPRGFKENTSYFPVDYDLMSPLKSAEMCKGKPPGAPVLTVRAGEIIPVRFTGSARHGGGLCQFALSYEGDSHFVVIKNYRYGCPEAGVEWPVKIPENSPSCERCTFAWSWVNAIGNREYYMNCADIKIIGTQGGALQGPPMKIFNLPGYPVYKPPQGYGGPSVSAPDNDSDNMQSQLLSSKANFADNTANQFPLNQMPMVEKPIVPSTLNVNAPLSEVMAKESPAINTGISVAPQHESAEAYICQQTEYPNINVIRKNQA